MLPTRPTRVALVALAVVTVACGDPTKPKATFANSLNSYTLTAFTGAPPTAATAVSFLGGATRADARFAFDVAVDLDESGRVLVYPVRSIGGGLAGALKRVGLRIVPGAFESVREAPETGYDTLAVRTVPLGAVLAVELLDFNNCFSSFGGQTIYAKLTVDSVIAASRRIHVRTVVDPNCGYRGLVPDSIPSR